MIFGIWGKSKLNIFVNSIQGPLSSFQLKLQHPTNFLQVSLRAKTQNKKLLFAPPGPGVDFIAIPELCQAAEHALG